MGQKNIKPSEISRWKRDFLVMACGETISLIGSSAVQFALIWWLASETGSALILSLAGLMAFLPQIILGPFAGVWVDRLPRKAVIIVADLFVALAAGVFAVLFLFGSPPYWVACVVLGLRSVGTVFQQPAIQAAVPMIVPSEELVRANGWSQFLQSGAFMLGPVLGAALYAAFPLPVIMLTDIIGALIACFSIAVIYLPDPERGQQQAPHLLREMKAGAAILIKDRRLCIITLASALCMIFYLPLASLYPLMTSNHFAGNAWHASIAEIVYAGGMMLCALLVSIYGEIKHKIRVVHIALIIMGAGSLLSGLLPADLSVFWLFALLCAVMGAGGNLSNIPYMAYLQQNIALEAQGRVFSLIGSLMSLAMPVGLVIAGPVAEAYGIAHWFLISGIAMIIIMLFSAVVTWLDKSEK